MKEQFVSNAIDRKAFVLQFIGAVLYWPLLRRNGLFFSLAGHDGSNVESLLWLSVFLLLCTVYVAVCCVIENRVRELIVSHGRCLLGLFGLQAICKSVEVFLSPAAPLGGFLAFIDVALYGFAFVVLTYMWSAWYLSMRRRDVVLFSSATFVASFALSDVVRLLPQWLGTVVFALFPFISAFIWVAFHRAGYPRVPVPDTEESASNPFAWNLVVTLAAFLLVGGLIRGAMTGVVDGGLSAIQPAMDVATGLFGLVLLVFSLLYRSLGRFLINAWSVAVVVFFAGLLFTVGYAGDSVERGRQIVIVGRTCLDLIYWIVLIGLVRDSQLSLVRTMGVWFVLIDIMSSLIGYIFAPMVLAALGIGYDAAAVPLATATAFILIVASILFFNRAFGSSQNGDFAFAHPAGRTHGDGLGEPAAVQPVAPRIETTTHDSIKTENMPAPSAEGAAFSGDAAMLEAQRAEHVDSVLAGYRLSERELEVAELLADGNSQKKIAETLYLSLGTVQSHIKNIYRKLDIHSRQELIDMMRR